ncbi:Proline dehydrogenase domain [Sesbania bispinosa]|nr:Proline dehydrogenase domain [Sesbania bispinosa]
MKGIRPRWPRLVLNARGGGLLAPRRRGQSSQSALRSDGGGLRGRGRLQWGRKLAPWWAARGATAAGEHLTVVAGRWEFAGGPFCVEFLPVVGSNNGVDQKMDKSKSHIDLLTAGRKKPAIDYFTYSSAIMHNNGENPIVFGTIQTYLKDVKERLLLTTEAADKMGVLMGFKLIRGKLAVAKAHELGIGKVNHRLEFAQLYGMSDALSFSLSNAGFQVSKYMPFGPIEMVMPYLLRRAEENKRLLAASGFDRQLIRKELGRRLKAVF